VTSAAPSALADDAAFEQRFARVEGLLAELAHSSDPLLERATREVLSTVLELHRRGLERVLEALARDTAMRDALSADTRVSAMLLLHGLHPIPVTERISRTLGTLRDRYRGKLESIDLEPAQGSQIVVRVVPTASACQSTRSALKKDVEEALFSAAPDAEALLVELVEAAPALITLRVRSSAAGGQATGGAR
jgi:hypothetical protein